MNNQDDKSFYRDSYILLFSNVAFLIELIIKLVSLEFKKFTATRLNIMDFFLCATYVACFVVDQFITGYFTLDAEDLYWTNKFGFLAALRLLRLINVARASQTLRVLLECVAFTFDAIGNFLVLLLIFLYVYSLLGMQLFAGRLRFD